MHLGGSVDSIGDGSSDVGDQVVDGMGRCRKSLLLLSKWFGREECCMKREEGWMVKQQRGEVGG